MHGWCWAASFCRPCRFDRGQGNRRCQQSSAGHDLKIFAGKEERALQVVDIQGKNGGRAKFDSIRIFIPSLWLVASWRVESSFWLRCQVRSIVTCETGRLVLRQKRSYSTRRSTQHSHRNVVGAYRVGKRVAPLLTALASETNGIYSYCAKPCFTS